MNRKVFSGTIGGTFVIVRIGFFGFYKWSNKDGTYKEFKLGLVFLKLHK